MLCTAWIGEWPIYKPCPNLWPTTVLFVLKSSYMNVCVFNFKMLRWSEQGNLHVNQSNVFVAHELFFCSCGDETSSEWDKISDKVNNLTLKRKREKNAPPCLFFNSILLQIRPFVQHHHRQKDQWFSSAPRHYGCTQDGIGITKLILFFEHTRHHRQFLFLMIIMEQKESCHILLHWCFDC